MSTYIKKKTYEWGRALQRVIMEILNEEAVPRVKAIILEDYDFNLKDISNPKSKLAPENYFSEFTKRLDLFDYVVKKSDGVKIVTPDMDNFSFKNGLESLQTVLEGLVGRYVEVDYKDYVGATKQQTYQGKKDVVYLVKYTPEVRNWERDLKKKFEEYAFSNTPPIDIFGRADEFVSDNIDKWIDKAIEKSQKEFAI